MNLYIKYILSLFLLSAFFFENSDEQSNKKHLVIINHPAFEKDDPREFYLSEMREDSHKVSGYFLDVKSVICMDKSCKIVPVRLFWDELGNYQKYDLPNGVILEKKEGKPFLEEDYKRLHEILKDKTSPYKDIAYNEIVQEKVHGEGEVDAISGATAVMLDKRKTVEGAAWTCYTLWHWANGDIVQEIQKITGKVSNIEELIAHLKSENHYQQLFAINELIRRKDYSPSVLDIVIQQADGVPELFKDILSYLEQAQALVYYQSSKKILKSSSKKRRIMLWSSILNYQEHPPLVYFDDFSEKLLETKDYQEINLFLRVLEQKQIVSPDLIEKFIPLLHEDYSILNRRVYWFLSDQKLSESQQQILDSYHNKYADYLD